MYLNLNMPDIFTIEDQPATMLAQNWVTAVHKAEGRFSAGLPAIQLANVCDAISVTLGPTGPDYPALDEITLNFLNYYYYTFGRPRPIRPGAASS